MFTLRNFSERGSASSSEALAKDCLHLEASATWCPNFVREILPIRQAGKNNIYYPLVMTEADHGQNGSIVATDDGRIRSRARVLEQIGPDTQRVLLPDGIEVHRGTPLATKIEILRNVEAWSNSVASSSNGSPTQLQFQEST